MVSRRNFFTITIIMVVLLFLFQAPEVVKDKMNHYNSNAYEEKTKTAYTSSSVHTVSKKSAIENDRYAVYIGDCGDGGTGSLVSQWCLYTKRYCESHKSLSEFSFDRKQMPEILLIDSAYLDADTDSGALLSMVQQGLNVIFCNLPESTVVAEHEDLMQVLGIRHVRKDAAEVTGLHLFEGLLLGGEKYYIANNREEEKLQDMELTVPWYYVSSGTKTYMVGMMDEDDMAEQLLENEDLPAVIWRNSIDGARVFAVNGTYLSDISGIGILDGMMAELHAYELYPVVNAQNIVMLNYPGFANENRDEMMKRYSQDLKAVYRDIVWPGITSVAERSHMGLTCMMAPQWKYLDGVEPDSDMVIYYMKLLQEQKAEAGLSGVWNTGVNLQEKLSRDGALLAQTVPDYAILSFYQGKLSDTECGKALQAPVLQKVRTIYRKYDGSKKLFDYAGEAVTSQMATNNGYQHTFMDDLRMNSIETALAYTSIATDISRVAYPGNTGDSWEKLFDLFSSNTDTYWKKYKVFDAATLSETDKRIRQFLALDYRQNRTGDTIELETQQAGESAWFILRTHGEEIIGTTGARYDKIEEGAYLIGLTSEKAQIELGNADMRYYYE